MIHVDTAGAKREGAGRRKFVTKSAELDALYEKFAGNARPRAQQASGSFAQVFLKV